MTGSSHAEAGCPSWANLARFVSAGGPWPVQHLQACPRCQERRALLEQLILLRYPPGKGADVGGCPQVVDLVALVEEELPASQRHRLGEHLCGCESCAAVFREIVAFQGEKEARWEVREPPPNATTPFAARGVRASQWSTRFSLRRATALLLLGLGLAAVVLSPFPAIDTGGPARWRGPAPILRAELVWSNEAEYPAARWSDLEGAESYRIRVWDETGERVYERHVAAGEGKSVEVTLTSEAAVGEVAIWQVDALRAGEVLATSGPIEVRWRSR